MNMVRFAGLIVLLSVLSTSLSAGVVGGPRTESGIVSANKYQEFTYQFEHFQNATIKVTFDIGGDASSTCEKLKVKILVDGQWFMTGAGRFDSAGVVGSEECIFEGGYGSEHKLAKDRRNVTIQVINETKEATPFKLATN